MNYTYQLLQLAHILLLVFWLGTDIGVFIAALWIKKLRRPLSERILLLQLAGQLDVIVRISAALMFPVGATLAKQRWGLEISLGVLSLLWLIAAIWCVAIIVAYRKQESTLAALIGKIQIAGLVVAGTCATLWGLLLLVSQAVPTWLAAKIVLFGMIYYISIGIDVTFRPVIRQLAVLPADGGDDRQEAALRSAINICVAVVLGLYVVVLASSTLGTMKFPG